MILGGLFPVHEKSETETEVCLKSMHQSQCNCNAATNHHLIDHHSQQILILPTRPVGGSFITGAYNAWRQCFTLWTSKFWTISYCMSYGQGLYLLYTLLCQYLLWTRFIEIYICLMNGFPRCVLLFFFHTTDFKYICIQLLGSTKTRTSFLESSLVSISSTLAAETHTPSTRYLNSELESFVVCISSTSQWH